MGNDTFERLNLGRLFLNRFRWIDASFQALMAEHGWPYCPKSNSLVFPHLLHGPIRPAEIARRAGVTRQAVHEVLAGLAEMDLVRIETDPADRRGKLVTLTDRGREFDEAIGMVVARIEQELGARIGRQSLDALRAALEGEWGEPMASDAAETRPDAA